MPSKPLQRRDKEEEGKRIDEDPLPDRHYSTCGEGRKSDPTRRVLIGNLMNYTTTNNA